MSSTDVTTGTHGAGAVPGTAGGFEPGVDPQRKSYNSYATFSDPDGNGWILQEVTTRLPGRVWED